MKIGHRAHHFNELYIDIGCVQINDEFILFCVLARLINEQKHWWPMRTLQGPYHLDYKRKWIIHRKPWKNHSVAIMLLK
jgi:hypothetical protein